MTAYVFHYDLELPACLRAAPILARLHRTYDMPATFFCLGVVLEDRGRELRDLFGDDPLFDLQSHTYSHALLKDNQMEGPGIGLEQLDAEIRRGIELVQEAFGRPCAGVRSGNGFFRGLSGEPERLRVIRDAGARYLSSDLRGPFDSVPGGLVQAYHYDAEGVPDLIELPGHGWHDNVLKGFDTGLRTCWPPLLGWGMPNRPPRDAVEEVAVQRAWIDRAVALGLDYVSPVYHPHSILQADAGCATIELLMRHLAAERIPVTTYTALYERYRADPDLLPGRDAWSWEDEAASAGAGGLRMLAPAG